MVSLEDIKSSLSTPILRKARLVQPYVRDENGKTHISVVIVLCEACRDFQGRAQYRYISHTGDIFTRDANMFTFLEDV